MRVTGIAFVVSSLFLFVAWDKLQIGYMNSGAIFAEIITYLYVFVAGIILINISKKDEIIPKKTSSLLLWMGIAGLAVLPPFVERFLYAVFDDTGNGGFGLLEVFLIWQLLALAAVDAGNDLRIKYPDSRFAWNLIIYGGMLSATPLLIILIILIPGIAASGYVGILIIGIPFLLLIAPVIISIVGCRSSTQPKATARITRMLLIGTISLPSLAFTLSLPVFFSLYIARFVLFIVGVFIMLAYGIADLMRIKISNEENIPCC